MTDVLDLQIKTSFEVKAKSISGSYKVCQSYLHYTSMHCKVLTAKFI